MLYLFSTSTNKVYGNTPNQLPMIEKEHRWELDPDAFYPNGINETMSIDNSTHSIFGASKVAADIMTQEYGKYFGLKTGVFRAGCLTGTISFRCKIAWIFILSCEMCSFKYYIYYKWL